jgi:hypothetical protein
MGATYDDLFAQVGGAKADASPTSGGAGYEDLFAQVEARKASALESGARGLAQELTFGFADEIAGGLESLFTSKTYQQARDESRANYAKAESDNPVAYGAGQVAGGLASLAIPVGGAIGRAASTGAKVARAAGAGAVYGAGKSEAEDLGGLAGDAATGAALGAGIYGAGKALGAGARKVVDVASKGGPLVDFAKKRAAGAIGGALSEALGGGGWTGYIAGEAVAALAPKAGATVRKLLARGEVNAARAAAKAAPGWEKEAAAALERAELAPAEAAARRAPAAPTTGPVPGTTSAHWSESAAPGLQAPELAPPTPRTSVAPTAPAAAVEPPRPQPLIGRDPKTGRFVTAKQAKKLGVEPEIPGQASAAPELAPVEPPPASTPAPRKQLQIMVGDRVVTPEELASTSAAAPPEQATGLKAQLAAMLSKRPPTVIPKEDRSTVDALINVMSSTAKGDTTLKHYPVSPDVAFKQYLAELPRAADASATGRRRALSQLIVGVRRGDDPGELIYKARAAGVPDEAIMRAVGVQPVARTAKQAAAVKKLTEGPTGAPAVPPP